MLRREVIHGDCLTALRGMPDASVDMVATSPPYFGLRNYATQPQIWGGSATCEHDWTPTKKIRTGRDDAAYGGKPHKGSNTEPRKKVNGDVCHKCSAWRGELGLEAIPDCYGWATGQRCGQCYIDHLTEIFREVKRVLSASGVAYLNLGDSYSGSANGGGGATSKLTNPGRHEELKGNSVDKRGIPGVKPKDLLCIPWLAGLSLRADGWYLRSDLIWAKGASFGEHSGSVMPESVRDRPSKTHEYILFLTKSEKYYWDQDAIKEPLETSSIVRMAQATFDTQKGGAKDYAANGTNANRSTRRALENMKKRMDAYGGDKQWKHDEESRMGKRSANRAHGDPASIMRMAMGRNPRSVWLISPQGFDGAHFAVYPEILAEKMILSGTSAKGHCVPCGAPWRRIKEITGPQIETRWEPICECNGSFQRVPNPVAQPPEGDWRRDEWEPEITVYAPRIPLDRHPVRPAIVLDPFGGAGTTGKVAADYGRGFVLIELQKEYIQIIRNRLGARLNPIEKFQETAP